MIGIYSKPLYDECNNKERLEISLKPGNWSLATPQESDVPCFSGNGPRNTRTGNSSEIGMQYNNAIDIESSLIGLDVPLTRCLNTNTLAERDLAINKLYESLPKKQINDCNDFLDRNDTRLNINSKVQETPYNRYEWNPIDHNAFIFYGINELTDSNNRHGNSSRIDNKNKLDQENKNLRTMAGKIRGQLQSL
jgi:hypothetical protein